VTADNATKTQGAPNPAFAASYSGLTNGDTAGSVINNLTITTTATTNSPVGSYSITPSGTLASSNYTVSYVDGVLTITAAAMPPTRTLSTLTGSILSNVTGGGFNNGSGGSSAGGNFSFSSGSGGGSSGSSGGGSIFTITGPGVNTGGDTALSSGTGLAGLTPMLSAPGGFRVAVVAGAAIVVARPIGTVDTSGGRVNFTVPPDAFAVTSPAMSVTLSATRDDGRPLPSWISFNPSTGSFQGTPPPGHSRTVHVKITARDSDGHEAAQVFTINLW
jgi:hypothetical protein